AGGARGGDPRGYTLGDRVRGQCEPGPRRSAQADRRPDPPGRKAGGGPMRRSIRISWKRDSARCTLDDLNMSGWRVRNVNLAGLKVEKANLAGAKIVEARLEGATIDGIGVTDLLACWRDGHGANDQ